MIQLILHLIGDYVTQSDWMANNKRKHTFVAFCHALVYSLPFMFIGSVPAVAVVFFTHFLIDRFGLARYVVYAKNVILSPSVFRAGDELGPMKWSNCSGTGYPSETPPWLAVWLLIAADNTLHLAINYAALTWL